MTGLACHPMVTIVLTSVFIVYAVLLRVVLQATLGRTPSLWWDRPVQTLSETIPWVYLVYLVAIGIMWAHTTMRYRRLMAHLAAERASADAWAERVKRVAAGVLPPMFAGDNDGDGTTLVQSASASVLRFQLDNLDVIDEFMGHEMSVELAHEIHGVIDALCDVTGCSRVSHGPRDFTACANLMVSCANPCQRIARLALAVDAQCRDLSDEVSLACGIRLKYSIGVSYGSALACVVGVSRPVVTVFGPAARSARRLSDGYSGGQMIYCTPSFRMSTGDAFVFSRLAASEEVWRLLRY